MTEHPHSVNWAFASSKNKCNFKIKSVALWYYKKGLEFSRQLFVGLIEDLSFFYKNILVIFS